jgi:hypothetical protein
VKKFFVATLCVSVSGYALGDKWECTDAGDQHVYKASQSVPGDNCRMIEATPESAQSKYIHAIMALPLAERPTTPTIGMHQWEVLISDWGSPTKKNKTTTADGEREQWVYDGGRYLYFDDGKLTAIQQ